MAAETAVSFVMERGFDLIEQLVQPPIDQFLKCVFHQAFCVSLTMHVWFDVCLCLY